MDKQLTLGSLFDGSGGFPLAATLTGIKPLWASELEPFCVRVTTKRFPNVKHLGDINHIKGAEIEPVDIITFGSPCQNLSIAGNRKGLDGSQSSLFHQAIRIIKEMREATNDHYPKYIVWENVCGAFSSNQGEDFKSVLESIIQITDETVTLTRPKKWENAGEIMGTDNSIAWRVLDAQYWGVPQRRKRIFLVADFTGGRASKILFESEGLSGYSHESFQAWQNATDCLGASTDFTSQFCLNDHGGQRMDVTENITTTLRASAGKTPLVFENHGQDSRYKGPLDKANTISATYGTGGNNQPFVIEEGFKTFDVRQTSDGTINTRNHCYETDTARTIDQSGNQPGTNQGGIAVVAVQGSVIGRKDENGPQGSGVNEDVSFTLNTVDHYAVAYSSCKNSHFTSATEEVTGTLVASDYKDPPLVSKEHAIVRRLTPKECARLQGFPLWWADDLSIAEPTEEDIAFWTEVFETHRRAISPNKKSKSRNQIIKWIKEPHSDSAEYKMWGNGVALPCVYFILAGIKWAEFSIK